MLLLMLLPLVAALPHSPQELVPMDRLGEREPSCETLRAMWRYSKRQSRAAQVTNEIPTYRDPFAYSIWDTGRDAQTGTGPGRATARSGLRLPPVYGRVVHNTPRWRNTPARGLLMQPMYRGQPGQPGQAHRNARISGGGLPPQQTGSLQRLKEMINQERLRDLQEQRLAEEAVAARQHGSKPEHYGRVVDGPRPVSSLDLVLASANNNNNNNKRSGEPVEPAEPGQEGQEAAPDQVEDEPW